MKRVLFIVQLLLMISSPSFAGKENLKKDVLNPVIHACGSYMPYQFEPQEYTPAPKGYSPVYVSHFGRHGSRYHTSESAFKSVLPVLAKAEGAGILTPKGKELYASLERFLTLSEGKFGKLTQIGINEHKEIASRMFRSFPEVFSSEKHDVRAVSSKVPRCRKSMTSFCDEMKGLNPALEIEQVYGKDWQGMVAPNHPEYKTFHKNGSWKKIYEDFAKKRIDSSVLVSSLFTDKSLFPSDRDARKFAENLFALATGRFAVPFEENLFSYFTDDEIFALWEAKNLKQYLSKGPSGIDNNVAISIAAPLLRDIIDRADLALASKTTAADLRFGHGEGIMPLTGLMGIVGMSDETMDPEQVSTLWNDWKITCLASNVQLIFYSNGSKKILVRVMVNEREVSFPIKSVSGPYYKWKDLKKFFLSRMKSIERV